MRQKAKKSTKYYIVSSLLAIGMVIVVTCIVGGCFIRKIQISYEEHARQTEEIIKQHTRTVYVPLHEIRAGELVEEAMLESREVLYSQSPEFLFSSDDIGKKALVDIAAGTYMIKNLVEQSEVAEECREVCYQSIQLTENIKNYDVVDVRIRYPNGEDYIVLTGKTICLDEENYGKCYLQLNEEEILMMSAAMYDVTLYRGTEIYTSRYIEPILQSRSVVTYLPSADLKKLMQTSPNISRMTTTVSEEMRMGLEIRLGTKKERVYE